MLSMISQKDSSCNKDRSETTLKTINYAKMWVRDKLQKNNATRSPQTKGGVELDSITESTVNNNSSIGITYILQLKIQMTTVLH